MSENRNTTSLAGNGLVGTFTLIELLVVITIISMLLAMLLPALKSARGMARGIGCASNLKQQGFAVASYANDFSGWLLTVDNYATTSNCAWKTYLAPYLVPGYDPAVAQFGTWGFSGVFKCPEWTYAGTASPSLNCYYGGYAWNYCVGSHVSYTDWSRRRNIANITRTSQTILIGDCTTDPASVVDAYCTQIWPPDWGGIWLLTTPKHRAGFNNLWADFHVDWQPRAFLLKGQSGGMLDGSPIAAMGYYYYPKTN